MFLVLLCGKLSCSGLRVKYWGTFPCRKTFPEEMVIITPLGKNIEKVQNNQGGPLGRWNCPPTWQYVSELPVCGVGVCVPDMCTSVKGRSCIGAQGIENCRVELGRVEDMQGSVWSSEHLVQFCQSLNTCVGVEGAPDGSKMGGILEWPLWPRGE